MGITAFSISLLEKALKISPDIKNVGEYGAQILYTDDKLKYASEWYASKGIDYTCFDLAGDNGAIKIDLSYPFVCRAFDLTTDFGQSEHIVRAEEYVTTEFNEMIHSVYPNPNKITDTILGFYYAWKNKFNLTATEGIMINENPRSGHWPGHGYHYLFPEFYYELSQVSDLEIIEVGENCAVGNCETGKNVYSILRKTGRSFPTFEQFKILSFTDH